MMEDIICPRHGWKFDTLNKGKEIENGTVLKIKQMIKIKNHFISGIGFLFQIGLIQKLFMNQFIRVVNYHCINKQFEMNFKSHIEFYKKIIFVLMNIHLKYF